ncbi:MAG: EAL domain-containing protein [Gammaproteobacteria bacterium]|nr:EAL domain-containing protein [Gammaproteobacteria bacterium]NNF61963.1 EAL domain-containing protein [Gammaproteobacteria bacterium]NNM21863.1 EAL domain-containing protein [Gammaproteobacteria bacterium]
MSRGFYSYSLVTLIAITVVTVGLTVALAIFSARSTALEMTDNRLASAHEMTRALLAVRNDLLRETALSLSLDPRVANALRSSDPAQIGGVLALHGNAMVQAIILFVNEDGSVRAHTGPRGVARQLDPQLLYATDTANFLSLGEQVHQVSFAPLRANRDSSWVGVAVPLDREFLGRVRSTTGVDIAIGLSGSSVATSTVLGEKLPSDRKLNVVLDQQGGSLTLAYSLPTQEALREFRGFASRLAAIGFAVSALAIFFGALVLGGIASRLVTRPVRMLRDGVERVRKGVYGEPVTIAGDDGLARMARAFNEMQAEIAERESRIVHHAEYDSLTGLTNRTVVADRLKALLGRTSRNGSTAAAMVIDIERFGDINGNLGNEIGDAVLQEVARRLASNTRATDLLARVGGDEFLIVVEDMEERLAVHISQFLAETLEKPIEVKGRAVNLRVHIGTAMYPHHSDSPEGLRRLSNVALVTAKETAQRVVMYEPGQDERHLRELAVLNDLDEAIKNGDLFLKYQPKIEMKTRNVDSVEALVRWQHPQLGLIPPDEFIGLLEENNKIHKLTDWVLKTAVAQVRDWTGKGFDLSVAVNISANDLLDLGLSQRIGNLLHHYLVDPKRLVVEVTESAVMQDPEQASRVLQTLRELGIKVSIDDFGTGQTSLSLLKKLPLNELKIDQSFVRNLRADSGDGIIIKSTVDLGHNMGLLVVAEGVENTYAWNLLKSYGCDSVQGYLIAKPLSSIELEAWYLKLQARNSSKLDLAFVDSQAAEQPSSKPEPQPRPETDILSEILGG